MVERGVVLNSLTDAGRRSADRIALTMSTSHFNSKTELRDFVFSLLIIKKTYHQNVGLLLNVGKK